MVNKKKIDWQKISCGSEGLCPHCKYKNTCAFSTYRINVEIEKNYGGGGVACSILKCENFVEGE